MSDQSSNNESLQSKTPGELLRAARELRGLPQSAVAEKLRLSVQTIIDIENDDYTHFPAEIYLRGHIRSFSRIVHIDENKVLQCYESMGVVFESEHREQLLSAQTVPLTTRARRSKRRVLLWVSTAVLLFLVIMVVLWWQEQQSHTYPSLSHVSGQTNSASIPITMVNTNIKKLIMRIKKATKKTAHHKAQKTPSHKRTVTALKKKVHSRSNDDYSHFVPDYKIVPVKQ